MKKIIKILLVLLLVFSSVLAINNKVYADDETDGEDVAETVETQEETEDVSGQEVLPEEEEEDDLPGDETVLNEEETQEEDPVPETEETIPDEEESSDEVDALSSDNGEAYAILTGEGDLIFFRSSESYGNEESHTVSIHGTEYSGTVFDHVESGDKRWFNYTEYIKRVYALDTIRPAYMISWFANCENLESFDDDNFDTSRVTSMDSLFYHCSSLKTLDLSDFDTSNVESMAMMFYICENLETVRIDSFITSKVKLMQCMFGFCYKLEELDLRNFNTSSVTDMHDMFEYCHSLTSLNVSSFNTSRVESMSAMFANCISLEELDLSGFDTSNVTDMNWMFNKDISLRSIRFSDSFDTSKVTGMTCMFNQNENLEYLDLSSFDTSAVTDMSSMFSSCSSLKKVRLGTGWTTWLSDGYLPEGKWRNETLSLYLESEDFCARYPEKADTWAGEWERYYADAILKDDGDLVFTRTLEKHTDGSVGTLSDLNGNTYTGRIFINVDDTGYPVPWQSYRSSIRRVYAVDQIKVKTMDSWFMNCKNLESFDGSGFDTSQVKLMDWLFYDCTKLSKIDVSGFDTRNVKYMNGMFAGTLVKSLDLRNYDTSSLEYCYNMFLNCSQLMSLDLSSFDTSKAVNMDGMFSGCSSLSIVKLGKKWTRWIDYSYLPAGRWENSSLSLELSEEELYEQYPSNASKWAGEWTRASAYAVLLPDGDLVFTRSLEHFYNESSGTLTDLKGNVFEGVIFSGVESTPYSYEVPWKNYRSQIVRAYAADTIRPQRTENWFYECENLVSFDSYGFDTSNADDMGGMFENCVNLSRVDLSHFETSNVMSMSSMFRGCETLTDLDLSNFDTSKVWYIDAMFDGCYQLSDLDIGSFDTSSAIHMNNMFSDCRSLKSLDLSHFNTSNVKSMSDMFSGCEMLETLDISGFDTSNVLMMDWMFYSCYRLKELDLSHFDTSSVTAMGNMFNSCTYLEVLDLSSFNTENVLSMRYMFFGCDRLRYLDISGFDTSNVSDMIYMISNDPSLEAIVLGTKITSLDSTCSLPGYSWTNGWLNLLSADFISMYPSNANDWAGVWYLYGSDAADLFGDVLPEDREARGYRSPSDIPKGLWIAGIEDVSYTGKAIKQEFRVYDYTTMLKEDKDYTVKYANNTKVGEAMVTVTGKGNYQGTLKESFKIKPVQMDGENTRVVLSKDVFRYNGKVQKPTVTVYFNGKKMKEGSDYELKFKVLPTEEEIAPKDPGRYEVAVYSKSGSAFTGISYEYFTISEESQIPVNTLKISLSYTKRAYTASYDVPDVVIKNGTEVIYDSAKGIDLGGLSVIAYDHLLPGTARIVIRGDDITYVGSVEKTFTITGKALSKAAVSLDQASYPYTGSDIKPVPQVKYGGAVLVEGTDYEIAGYENNLQIGTATIILNGLGGYTGTAKKTFKIVGTTISAKNVSIEGLASSYPYEGTAIEPAVIVRHDGTVLNSGTDYVVSFKNNVNAGTATMTFTGTGAYSGSFSKTFRIDKAKIVEDDVIIKSYYAYLKGGVTPLPDVYVGGRTLVKGSDYTLSYKNNKKVGTASITVKGKGNYSGTVTKTFEVTKHYLSGLTMTAADKLVSKKAAAMSTTISITDSNGKKLTASTDYEKSAAYTYVNDTTWTDASGETIVRRAGNPVEKTDIVPVNTLIQATVTLKGNYAGKIRKTFRIIAGDIAKATVTIRAQYYTGSAVTLNEDDIKVVLNKQTLVYGTDFRIVSYDKNAAKGTASVVIEGINDYGGRKTVKFTIKQRSMGITIRFDGNGASSGSMSDQLIYKSTTLSKCTFKKSGKTFAGWAYNPDGWPIFNADNGFTFPYDKSNAGKTIVLYAIWNDMP